MRTTFSERISNLREEKGYTREQLAEKLWVSPHMVQCWEEGSAAPASMDVVEMSRIFGVESTSIFGDDIANAAMLPVLVEEPAAVSAVRYIDPVNKVNKTQLFCGCCWTLAAACNFFSVVVGKNFAMCGLISLDVFLAVDAFKKYKNQFHNDRK